MCRSIITWKIAKRLENINKYSEPVGFMKIGLYSYLARQSIAKFEKVKGDFVNKYWRYQIN